MSINDLQLSHSPLLNLKKADSQTDRDTDSQVLVPLVVFILSVRTRGLGVLLSGLTENSMRRHMTVCGGVGGGTNTFYESHSNWLFGGQVSLGQRSVPG